MKKSSRRLALIIVALIVTLAIGTTSTYAWFTLNEVAKVENILLQVDVAPGIEIAGGHPGKIGWTGRWYSSLNNFELLFANGYLTDIADAEGNVAGESGFSVTDGVINAKDAEAYLRLMSLKDLTPMLQHARTSNYNVGTFNLINADGTLADYAYLNLYKKMVGTEFGTWQPGMYLYEVADDSEVFAVNGYPSKEELTVDPLTKSEVVAGDFLSANTYWVPYTHKTENLLPMNERGYLAFDVSLRTAKVASAVTDGYIPVYLSVPSMNVLNSGGISNPVLNILGDGLDLTAFGGTETLAQNAQIPASAENAARFGYIPYDSSATGAAGAGGTYNPVLPEGLLYNGTDTLSQAAFYGEGTDTSAKATIYDPRSVSGYYLNQYDTANLARKYYLAFNGITNMAALNLTDYFENYDYAHGDLAELAVLTSSTATGKEIGRLYPVGGGAANGRTYYQGTVRVYIWAEGKDGDCFNSIIGQMFNSQMGFTIPAIIGG